MSHVLISNSSAGQTLLTVHPGAMRVYVFICVYMCVSGGSYLCVHVCVRWFISVCTCVSQVVHICVYMCVCQVVHICVYMCVSGGS